MLGRGYESFGHALLRSVKSTHPPLPIGLLHQDHICQPLRVLNLPYVASVQQLLRFFLDDPPSFFIELPPSLANGLDLGVHGEAVAQEIWVYVWHV